MRSTMHWLAIAGSPTAAWAQGIVGSISSRPAASLNLQVVEMRSDVRRALRVPDDAGLLVFAVTPGGVAQRAGLQVGDVLISLAGKRLDIPFELAHQLAFRTPGEQVVLEILRQGTPHSLRLPLGEVMADDAFPGFGPAIHSVPRGFDTWAFEDRTRALEERIRVLEERIRVLERQRVP